MKSRFQIRKIEYEGEEKRSSINLYDGLNVIHGESNTGKSLILLSIQHVFGKDLIARLSGIPELNDYLSISIVIETAAGNYKITRDIRSKSNDITVYCFNKNSVEYCRPEKATKKKRTISEFLLSVLNGTDFKLRKNKDGDTVNLTYKKLMLVSILDEARIINLEYSPFLSGVVTSLTQEKSAFKLFIQDEDDSNCNAVEKADVVKSRLNGSIDSLSTLKQELIDDISDLTEDNNVDEYVEYDPKQKLKELQEEISKLNNVIHGFREEQSSLTTTIRKLDTEKLFSIEIINRFNLYLENLLIDQERMQFVEEGNFYFDQLINTNCPTCGAEFTQDIDDIPIVDGYKKEAYEAEFLKIKLQIKDIMESIKYHEIKINEIEDSINTYTIEYDRLEENIDIITSNELEPIYDEIKMIEDNLLMKSNIEQKQKLLKTISDKIFKLRGQLLSPTNECNYDSSMALDSINSFIDYLNSNLVDWAYPLYNICEFNEKTLDIRLDNKLRISNGKGHRAILAAAMVISLLEYCTSNNFLHNGFVILDSPLLSLKERSNVKSNEIVSDFIADNFFRKLALKSGIQIIILENKEPPKINDGKINIIEFTNGNKPGRKGLLE